MLILPVSFCVCFSPCLLCLLQLSCLSRQASRVQDFSFGRHVDFRRLQAFGPNSETRGLLFSGPSCLLEGLEDLRRAWELETRVFHLAAHMDVNLFLFRRGNNRLSWRSFLTTTSPLPPQRRPARMPEPKIKSAKPHGSALPWGQPTKPISAVHRHTSPIDPVGGLSDYIRSLLAISF